ncbi:hypothetical protein JRG66_02930 [Salinimicrobium tongyeongense]|jgi:hypothetical protein|uniref:DUF4878 domain-containing protein n=1 Tax=Salinimicrobium tongyeongense TaxID=2809707 RepID=A0ABY6NSI1_9FLAO|nr:hypothetical protein [Salinimicrobium tongyeongense]UZH55855.1 hypothetical protein JRG66_02930 [Salinimicrobium tongyeongense]
MKRILLYSVILALVGCNEKKMAHTETAKIVAESFYYKDNATLKKHTTTESYAILSSLQDLFAEDEKSEINFEVIEDTINSDVAWVRYSTSFEEKPSIFKLVKEDGQWKVTEQKPREEEPF